VDPRRLLEAETIQQGKRNRYFIKKSVPDALENDQAVTID